MPRPLFLYLGLFFGHNSVTFELEKFFIFVSMTGLEIYIAIICTAILLLALFGNKGMDITQDAKSFISRLSIYDGKQFLFSITSKSGFMALSLTDTQQASGVLSFVDKKGAPTDVADGAVTITSSDPAIAAVTYDDPTNTVTVVAGTPGVATLTIVATNKAGATLPFDDIAVEVLSGDAASGTIAFGAPTEQP